MCRTGGGKGGVGERQLKGFLKLWLWGLMAKYKVNNSYHPCSLPLLPQKGAPMSKSKFWHSLHCHKEVVIKMLMAMVVTAVVLSVSLIVAPFVLLLVLLLLVVVSKVRAAVAMTHDQMRSEGGNIVDTCLMTTSSSLSSPSVLSLTPPSKPTPTSPLTISLLTPLSSKNNTKEFDQNEFYFSSCIG